MEKGPKNPDSEKEGKINRRDFLKTIAKVTGVAAAAGASAVAMEKRAEKQNPEFKIEELLKMIKENEKKLVTAEYDIPGEIDPSEIKFYKGKQDKLVEMQTKLREKYAEIEDLEKQIQQGSELWGKFKQAEDLKTRALDEIYEAYRRMERAIEKAKKNLLTA